MTLGVRPSQDGDEGFHLKSVYVSSLPPLPQFLLLLRPHLVKLLPAWAQHDRGILSLVSAGVQVQALYYGSFRAGAIPAQVPHVECGLPCLLSVLLLVAFGSSVHGGRQHRKRQPPHGLAQR